jgi:hypothetical protein
MYPMTTQPASDLRHNIWSLVFGRLGQSSPPFGAGGLFGGRFGDADPLNSYTGTIAAPSLGAGDRFLSRERLIPIQALCDRERRGLLSLRFPAPPRWRLC